MMVPGDEVANLEPPPAAQTKSSLQDLLATLSGGGPSPNDMFSAPGGFDNDYGNSNYGQGIDGQWGSNGGSSDNYGGGQGAGNGGGGGWNGQGLPPPTGERFDDEWSNVPTGPRNRQQQPFEPTRFPAGIRYNAPCKYYNTRRGRVTFLPPVCFATKANSEPSFIPLFPSIGAAMETRVHLYIDGSHSSLSFMSYFPLHFLSFTLISFRTFQSTFGVLPTWLCLSQSWSSFQRSCTI